MDHLLSTTTIDGPIEKYHSNKWTDRQHRLEEAFEKLREEFEGQDE